MSEKEIADLWFKGCTAPEISYALQISEREVMQTIVRVTNNQKKELHRTLFDAIKHGDEKHQAWLKKAIEDHFAGRPVLKPDNVS